MTSDWGAAEATLRALMRGKFSSLTLSFNDHAANYCDVKTAIERGQYDHVTWMSDEEKSRAIETNSVWELHWYPDSPVGFYAVAASTLPALFAHIAESKLE